MSERTYEQISDLPTGITPTTGAELVELEQDGVSRKFSLTELGGVTAVHQGTHQFGSTDPVGTHDKVANAIPYLNSSGLIDDHVSDASETVPGKVELAEDGESAAGKAVQSDDGRLSDARTPTGHASSHYGVGDDLIPDATTEASGLMSNEDKTLLDNRLPSADEKAALVGSEGTPSGSNEFVTTSDPRLPTADQKAALAGTSGYPSVTNKFVTDADPRLGGVDIDITDISNWASYYKVFSYDQPTGQTNRAWEGLASYDGDLYASVHSGDIYKMDGAGVFQPTGQTDRSWRGLASHDGDLYASVGGGDIYKMDGAGVFQPTGQTTRGWAGLASHDGDLYASVGGGDIYKMDGAGVFQPTGQTTRNWEGLASHDGDLYASVYIGDIYKMDGSGVFQPTGQTNRFWRGLASHNGELYACPESGDIYKLTTANPTVNLPNVCTRYIPTNFPVNGRKVYRRLAAYDGNAVILYPPSGATFEGKASISLYGQYSYIEIERISATVFAIRDLYDGFKYIPAVGITNLPGSWDLNDTRCIRTKGSLIKLFLRYLVTGAATGSISITKANILPSGIAVRASVFSHPITYRDVSPVDVSGVGVYATSYLTTSTGAYWNATVPFTWASGDGVFMCLEYEEV